MAPQTTSDSTARSDPGSRRTVEVPREAWLSTLDEFTRLHEGWLVSLDVLKADLGAQSAIEELPLLGISADRLEHDGTIAISVARSGSEHLTHFVQAVTRMYREQRPDGADVALQLESADGTRTIIRFRVAAAPETVNGILHS
jgi:hypothetical protein